MGPSWLAERLHGNGGQWVFGGVEEQSRKCFLVAVEKRHELTVLPIIRKWIEPIIKEQLIQYLIQINIRKIVYLNCVEIYEDILIIAVMHTTSAVVKLKPEKNSGLN